MNTVNEISERNQSLWMVAASPTIWMAHFLLSYSTAAIWCGVFAGRDGSLWNIRLAIAAYTVIALSAIGWIAWFGYRRHRLGKARVPHDEDTPEDRHRFLGFATFLLSGLSAIATIFGAITVLFIRSCQ